MDIDFLTLLLVAAVSLAAPLLIAALGELISETAGVINIQLEAMMLVGAFVGVAGALLTQNIVLAFAGAIVGGLIVAALHGIACFWFRANQIVSGVTLNILALGATTFLLVSVMGADVTQSVARVERIPIPVLSQIPVIGPALFAQNVVVYLAFVAVPIIWWMLDRTSFGLALRSAGERPEAAESLGIDVNRTRWMALAMCGALAGIAGGLLTLGGLGFFTPNVTAGRGFIALAAVVFGRWRPAGTLVAVLLFSVVDAFQIRAQTLGLPVPYQLLVALPYLVTIIALAGFITRMRPPSALGVNYEH
jgi:general nucleoside transport system permease protein